MRRSAPRRRDGWPAVPRGAEAWVALPEIPLGRYLLADIGWVSSERERAFVAGVAGLPAPSGTIDNGFVALPAVIVVGDDGQLRMFRLPIGYATIVRQFALDDGSSVDLARAVVRLPCHFVIGDEETIYLAPDDLASRSRDLN